MYLAANFILMFLKVMLVFSTAWKQIRAVSRSAKLGYKVFHNRPNDDRDLLLLDFLLLGCSC